MSTTKTEEQKRLEANTRAAKHRAKNPLDPAKRREYFSNWKKSNEEHYKEMRRGYKLKYPAKYLYFETRQRAKKQNLPFTLTVDWINEKLKSMTCSVTNLPLSLELNGKSRGWPFAPSLYRINREAGYTKTNTRVVCWLYNAIRLDWHEDDFNKVITTLARILET